MARGSGLERWHELLEERRRQMEQAYARLGRDTTDFWMRRAAGFRRAFGVADERDPLVQRVLTLLPPDGSVLDVGAGYGRLALPLARHACEVIAIEPQAVMATYLTEDAAQAGIANVQLVQEGWMEVRHRIPPADVVLCAGVLVAQPGQADITAWLSTLDAHARCGVVIGLPASRASRPQRTSTCTTY
jgi:2-polyprenyl-3-methyl-5-hydroxy-6-metoxy-1,4-benzoquinol methylase